MEQTELFPKTPKPSRRRKPVPEFKPKLVPRPKRKPAPAPEPVVMNLGVRHTINGMAYGPGPATIPAHLVSTILENEQRNAAEEQRLYRTRAVLISRGHTTRDVDPSFFDDPQSNFVGAPAI